MRETAVNFGAAGNLSGVLVEPDAGKGIAHAPVALFWNIGIHHRVGSYRVWVDLSRQLADAGFTSLRFDLSGMGDSEVKKGGAVTDGGEDRSADLDEAMTFVTKRTGLSTFAPMGFCSGIDQLHPLGLKDERVVAMAYIEGYSWKTRGYYARYPLRYLRATLWKDRLAHLPERKSLGALRRLFKSRDALAVDPMSAQEAQGGLFARDYPTAEKFANDLTVLRHRGVKLFFAYFGLETGFTHAGQFSEMTGLLPSEDLELFFLGGADHILYRTADRALVLGQVTAWMRRHFGAGSAGRARPATAAASAPAM
jgi:hypothetical protein